jgi:SNF2 family DNA or RNA helicase
LDGLGDVDIEDVEPSTKMQRVGAILENIRAIDPTQKTLVFSSFVELLELMRVYLRKKGIKHLLYTGRMKLPEREANLKAFSAEGGPEVLLMSLKAGAVGLNLTAASNVVMLDLAWSPATEAQAIDRSHRIVRSPRARE